MEASAGRKTPLPSAPRGYGQRHDPHDRTGYGYLRGRQLLEKRKYAQALYVLHDYRDRNTAIALLSLGQDREALRILEALPATATSEYLRAIACSRLGRKAEGRRHFLEACRRDERMEYRAALDPEIDDLLKN